MKKVFIDGSAGTTGLRIFDRLHRRTDIQLLTLPESERKLEASRKKMLNEADVVFLCLPDDAACEAALWVENPDTVVLDTSTAHRTAPGWCYGFPELSPVQEARLRQAKRIAVPGCHASGFIALVYPLVSAGLLTPDALLSCYSLSGYSGGGKKMIAEYRAPERSFLLNAPRQYALGQTHKHLKEMKAVTGLANEPVFCPVVADFYSGMQVTVPLFASWLAGAGRRHGGCEKRLQDPLYRAGRLLHGRSGRGRLPVRRCTVRSGQHENHGRGQRAAHASAGRL